MNAKRTVLALAVVLAASGLALGQTDVTAPGDAILLVNGLNDGDGNSGPPPANEGVEHAIDDVGQKYLNFLDLGSGFIVTPSMGATLVTGLRLYTANDAVERDPASYVLEGGLDPAGPFVVISQGSLALPDVRNAGGNTALDALVSANQLVTFPNVGIFTSYRLTFPTLKNADAANSMQIAEVELLGVPEPTTMALIAAAGLGFLARRRARKA